MRNWTLKLDKVELLIMLGILIITGGVAYAIISAAHQGYIAEEQRKAEDTCRNIAGHRVPCSN